MAKKKETAAENVARIVELSNSALQCQLEDKFDALDVQQRDGSFGKKLDYVPINKFIERMNQVFPLGYDWELRTPIITDDSIFIIGDLTVVLADGETRVTRSGIGSDKLGKDPDKAAKTAMAEAFKKACHTFGISLYLWDEGERRTLARERIQALEDASAPKTFSDAQIESMKTIKSKLETEGDLESLLGTWSQGKIKSPHRLNVNNIDNFITFANEELGMVTA